MVCMTYFHSGFGSSRFCFVFSISPDHSEFIFPFPYPQARFKIPLTQKNRKFSSIWRTKKAFQFSAFFWRMKDDLLVIRLRIGNSGVRNSFRGRLLNISVQGIIQCILYALEIFFRLNDLLLCACWWIFPASSEFGFTLDDIFWILEQFQKTFRVVLIEIIFEGV